MHVTGAERVAFGTRQPRNTEGEPIANEEECETGEIEMEGADVEKDVTRCETIAEIKMGAATSND
jgi:hypothetical protein